MSFKNRKTRAQIPEVNLVPMMDVLMTVLTFFIIISMTLTGQQMAGVNLPQTAGDGTTAEAEADATLMIGLDRQGQILLENQPIARSELAEAMRTFLSQNPNGSVLLKADRELTYDEVTALLKTMRDAGGDRVLLAIDRS
ncbi:biopolymer transporter ExbD [Oculatella sp. LEGE 06141]|uniref:ExbD/TolR family protein n=1 Tax=Oculatella sp. LEGE 06141 TaxID=1828648 RepID=UPI0018825D3C|nr:biopolymer transporter ExbD [Oculatella sp. LEGE 06141]MBE9179057.1 biopolymer transporter ExbD [Oculatella sp. LEGE 06141]